MPSRRQLVSFPPSSHALPRDLWRPHPRHHGRDGAQIQERGPPDQRRPAQRPRRGKEGPAAAGAGSPLARAGGTESSRHGGRARVAARRRVRCGSAGGLSSVLLAAAGQERTPFRFSYTPEPELARLRHSWSGGSRASRAREDGDVLPSGADAGLPARWAPGRLPGEDRRPEGERVRATGCSARPSVQVELKLRVSSPWVWRPAVRGGL